MNGSWQKWMLAILVAGALATASWLLSTSQAAIHDNTERIVRLETQNDAIKAELATINRKLDRLLERENDLRRRP